MSSIAARTAADRLIARLSISSAPVDVHKIAKSLGLAVITEDLGSDISALLVTDGKSSLIGVHNGHVTTRQRFSIAHEIGHFVLRHQFEPGEHVHVDRGRYVSERGLRSSAGVDPKEIEANQFAACLLMPAKVIREHIGRLGKGPLSEDEVRHLAGEFEVSEQAMTIRLSALGLF
jgi:Zn-dependent peptidase ImmA (M78 family)